VGFSFIDISVESVTGLENDADETIWINDRVRGQTFLLCNTYRPEWKDSEYWTRLNHAIGMGYQVNDNIVILGDSNSDLIIANNNILIETMMMFNLVNIISKTTRITDHSNTLLDPIIISDTINYIYSDVLKEPSEISNHDASAAFLRVLLVHLSGKSGYIIKLISKYLSNN
jgi:hypothetical protein